MFTNVHTSRWHIHHRISTQSLLATHTMGLFLLAFRHSIRLKCLVGICPFALNARRGAYLSNRVTAIAVTNILCLLCFFVVLALSAIEEAADSSATQAVVVVIDHWSVGMVYIVMLIKSLIDRRRHVTLINALDRLHEQLRCQRSYTGHQVGNALIYIVYLCLPTCNLFLFGGQNMPLPTKLFVVSFCFIMTNVMAFMMHIQDIAIALNDSIDSCLAPNGPDCDMMDTCAENLQTLSALCDLKDDFQQCFGYLLLLNTLKDLIVVTIILFYVIAQCVFMPCDIDEQMFYVGVYVAPIVAKNVRLVVVIGRLEQQVASIRRMVLTIAELKWCAGGSVQTEWSDGVSVKMPE